MSVSKSKSSGEWHDGILGCFNDLSSCCLTTFGCACYTWGKTMAKAGICKSMYVAMLVFFVLECGPEIAKNVMEVNAAASLVKAEGNVSTAALAKDLNTSTTVAGALATNRRLQAGTAASTATNNATVQDEIVADETVSQLAASLHEEKGPLRIAQDVCGLILLVILIWGRRQLVDKYHINENLFCSVFKAGFCALCAICQQYRHVHEDLEYGDISDE